MSVSGDGKNSALLLLTLLAGWSSREFVVPVAATCPAPPSPPAWAMQAPSNSVRLLDQLFSISAPVSSPIKQP
ncbi:lysis system o-spanin lipoprotein Rz1 [Pseudomonas veronii]|uniref:lysis system o-spanin lipoprotein Rz1 n=1 Tax=Pseudomonas veronii TaxID=76761 RepID=UPI003B97BDCE